MTEMSPEARKAVELIQKLLNLASKNPNEAEAAAAMEKAQRMMEDYNLDLSKVERANGDTGKRDWSAYSAGYKKGDDVSIDQQAGRNKTAGLLK